MVNFIILCGGLGTRFHEVSRTTPKILIEVENGLSMLDWFLKIYLPKKSRVILATGFLHEKIFNYVKNNNYNQKIIFSKEDLPLGTGGAICNASRFVDSEYFVALNGDTIQELNINTFLEKSKLNKNTIINVGCSFKKKKDSGMVLIDDEDYIKNFTEKKLPASPDKNQLKLVSSLGIYNCRSSFFQGLPLSNISLEQEIIPKLVSQKKAKATIFKHDFYDFGTFERYQKLFKGLS